MRPALAWSLLALLVAIPGGAAAVSTGPITGLNWVKRTYVAVEDPFTHALVPTAQVTGTYDRPEWKLTWVEKQQELPQGTPFTISVPITAGDTGFTLEAAGPGGARETHRFIVGLSESDKARVTAPQEPQKRFYLNAGLGLSYVSYQERVNNVSVEQFGTTGKVAGGYRLIPGKVDVGASAYVTVFSIFNTPSTLVPARFYGVNTRLGYVVAHDFLGGEWIAMGGWYFWGMLVPQLAYGITKLNGPQFFLSTRWVFQDKRTLGWYVKYAPLEDGSGTFDPKICEAATGGSIQLSPPKKSDSWVASLTLDLSYAFARSVLVLNSAHLKTASVGIQFSL